MLKMLEILSDFQRLHLKSEEIKARIEAINKLQADGQLTDQQYVDGLLKLKDETEFHLNELKELKLKAEKL